jgi:hypothetical protein
MAWRYLDQLATGYTPQLPHPGYDFAQVEYAGSPLSTGFNAPDSTTTNRNQETSTGAVHQTFINCFTLADLNSSNKSFLARITPLLPIELAPHSKPPALPSVPTGGRSRSRERYRRVLGVGEAERERERLLRVNAARDPRFDWGLFPKTVGWRERGEKEVQEERARTADGRGEFACVCERRLLTLIVALDDDVDQQIEQVEIDIDFRVDDGQGELQFSFALAFRAEVRPAETTISDTSNLKRKRRDAPNIPRTNAPSSFVHGSRTESSDIRTRQNAAADEMQDMDAEERDRRAVEMLRLAKERAARKRQEREKTTSTGRRVTWVPRLYDRESAPVVPSRFGYYVQWLDRYRAEFDKIDAEDEAEEQRIKKLIREGRADESLYEQARNLEAAAPTSSRSKYNPKSNPDYAPPEPPHIPTYFPPMPKEGQPVIAPHVPRHRQVQPVKSSLFSRASRRVTEAAWTMGARAVGAMRSVLEGVASFVGNGGASPRGAREAGGSVSPLRISTADNGRSISALESGLRARTLANERLTSVTARMPSPPPPVEEEDEKSDTEDRFYQPPPATGAFEDDEDEDDAFVQMSNQSRGTAMMEQRQKSAKSQGKAPAVVVHSTRNLDASPAEPAALPEIGTGASRPLTRDNTAFNAAGLDFVPLGIDDNEDKTPDLRAQADRLTSRLPSNATRAQHEAADANDRYHAQERLYELQQRQWQEYLQSLGSVGEQREVGPFRPADSWRDDESDAELTPEESEESGDEGPLVKRSRGVSGTRRRGRSREKRSVEDQPDDKDHPRLKSPPPERRLANMDDADEDEKADFDNTVGGRLRAILEQYDKRYEPEVVHSDDSDAENPDFAGIELDDDLEDYIDDIEVPELAAAPLYGSGFNRDRVMPKLRRSDQDRERDLKRQRNTDRRNREADERRGGRWASGVPGQRSHGW